MARRYGISVELTNGNLHFFASFRKLFPRDFCIFAMIAGELNFRQILDYILRLFKVKRYMRSGRKSASTRTIFNSVRSWLKTCRATKFHQNRLGRLNTKILCIGWINGQISLTRFRK